MMNRPPRMAMPPTKREMKNSMHREDPCLLVVMVTHCTILNNEVTFSVLEQLYKNCLNN